MARPLHEIANEVENEATFLIFVQALVNERQSAVAAEQKEESSPWGPDAGGWENTTIEDYLEAAAAWAEDTSFGSHMGDPDVELYGVSPWRRFAAFLLAGIAYE